MPTSGEPYVFQPSSGPKIGQHWEIRCGSKSSFAPLQDPNPAAEPTAWVARRIDEPGGAEYVIRNRGDLSGVFGNETAGEVIGKLPRC